MEIDKAVYEAMLETLLALKESKRKPANWDEYGFCVLWESLFEAEISKETPRISEQFNEVRRKLFRVWHHFSGSASYPVPATGDLRGICITSYTNPDEASAACRMYQIADEFEFWDKEASDYAELRWDLIEHCITELEKMVKE